MTQYIIVGLIMLACVFFLLRKFVFKPKKRDCSSGCGKCAEACHENAIGMVDGKARLLRDDYCDGLGAWLCWAVTGLIVVTTLYSGVEYFVQNWKCLWD